MKLRLEQRLYLTHLAGAWHSPQEAADAFFIRYKVAIDRRQAERFDPTTAAGRDLAHELVQEFYRAREAFTEKSMDLAIFQRAWRLRELQRMYDANRKGSRLLSIQLLEAAAKEVGGWFDKSTPVTDSAIQALLDALVRPDESSTDRTVPRVSRPRGR